MDKWCGTNDKRMNGVDPEESQAVQEGNKAIIAGQLQPPLVTKVKSGQRSK